VNADAEEDSPGEKAKTDKILAEELRRRANFLKAFIVRLRGSFQAPLQDTRHK